MLVLSSNIIFAQFGGGRGTEQSPYQIRTREHIEELAYFVKAGCQTFECFTHNKYFKLMNDITDSVRCVIGEGYYISTNFEDANVFYKGHFDGQGHKITLAIVSDGHASLFGTAIYSTIQNLRVDGYVKKSGNSRKRGWVFYDTCYSAASIVGFAYKTKISNCINYANIYIDYLGAASVGGIVGSFFNNTWWGLMELDIINGAVLDCINFGNIEIIYSPNNNHTVGGIIGTIYHSLSCSIKNCINFGTLKYNFQPVFMYSNLDNPALGGIFGKYICAFYPPYFANRYGITTEIENCRNIGFIDGPGGGIFGTFLIVDIYEYYDELGGFKHRAVRTELKIKNCLNAGFISGSGGGIAFGKVFVLPLIDWQVDKLTIENCINTGVLGGKPTNRGIANID